MASISNDPNGRRRILFVAPDGSRKTIRLGKIDRKGAESICRHVEALLSARIGGQTLARDTAAWLPSIGDKLRTKLAVVGLIEPVLRLTFDEFLTGWITNKREAGFKPTSLRAWAQTADSLKGLFGKKMLTSIDHADGEAFQADMRNRGLRPTTMQKRIGHARQMLEDAVRLGHLPSNPWKHVRQRAGDPSERRAYIPVTDAERVLEHCPNVWWKLLVALARFGGLRIPSEAFSLTWGDVDWERGRLSVPSPKTENAGKSHRVIPLFPLLRPHLETAFEHAEEGTLYILPEAMRKCAQGPDGWGGANLRTTFTKIIRRAGVDPWPRVWHSLRASCESDLAQSFPLATVTKWLGNTPSVALRHYVDPTETAFDTALDWMPAKSGEKSGAVIVEMTQKTAQQPAADKSTKSQSELLIPTFQSTSAKFCDSTHEPAEIVDVCLREWMGIEPTEPVVHGFHRF
ncbi:hypothetical protein BH11PLA2_BH11PLA2_07700 [soil metagenome]